MHTRTLEFLGTQTIGFKGLWKLLPEDLKLQG